MADSGAPAVAATQLRVRRGDKEVLPGISFSIPAGGATGVIGPSGLLGPSGCGKTTLMRSIVGVQIIESGTIDVFGTPAGSPELRSRVGYVTQAPSVYGDLTVRENLQYFARVLNVGPERVDEAIRTVALSGHADQVVQTLSGGEQSRVS